MAFKQKIYSSKRWRIKIITTFVCGVFVLSVGGVALADPHHIYHPRMTDPRNTRQTPFVVDDVDNEDLWKVDVDSMVLEPVADHMHLGLQFQSCHTPQEPGATGMPGVLSGFGSYLSQNDTSGLLDGLTGRTGQTGLSSLLGNTQATSGLSGALGSLQSLATSILPEDCPVRRALEGRSIGDILSGAMQRSGRLRECPVAQALSRILGRQGASPGSEDFGIIRDLTQRLGTAESTWPDPNNPQDPNHAIFNPEHASRGLASQDSTAMASELNSIDEDLEAMENELEREIEAREAAGMDTSDLETVLDEVRAARSATQATEDTLGQLVETYVCPSSSVVTLGHLLTTYMDQKLVAQYDAKKTDVQSQIDIIGKAPQEAGWIINWENRAFVEPVLRAQEYILCSGKQQQAGKCFFNIDQQKGFRVMGPGPESESTALKNVVAQSVAKELAGHRQALAGNPSTPITFPGGIQNPNQIFDPSVGGSLDEFGQMLFNDNSNIFGVYLSAMEAGQAYREEKSQDYLAQAIGGQGINPLADPVTENIIQPVYNIQEKIRRVSDIERELLMQRPQPTTEAQTDIKEEVPPPYEDPYYENLDVFKEDVFLEHEPGEDVLGDIISGTNVTSDWCYWLENQANQAVRDAIGEQTPILLQFCDELSLSTPWFDVWMQ